MLDPPPPFSDVSDNVVPILRARPGTVKMVYALWITPIQIYTPRIDSDWVTEYVAVMRLE